MYTFNKAKPALVVSVFMDVKTCHGLCCKKQTSRNPNVIQSCDPIQNRRITSIISPCKCHHFESKWNFSCWPKKVQQTSLAQYPAMVHCNLICWLIMHCIVNYILYFDVISSFCGDPYCVLSLLLGRYLFQLQTFCICRFLLLSQLYPTCSCRLSSSSSKKVIGRATYQPSENCSFLRQIWFEIRANHLLRPPVTQTWRNSLSAICE